MNIIIGERCSGKTTRLIKLSAEEGFTILTGTVTQANIIFNQAKDMGLEIPHPISVHQLLDQNRKAVHKKQIKGLLIDELDIVLSVLLEGYSIKELTITDKHNIEFLKFIDKPKFRV